MAKTTKKAEKKEQELVPYLSTSFLRQAVGKLKVNTMNDINAYKEILGVADQIDQELRSNVVSLREKFGFTPEEEIKEDHEKYNDLLKEYTDIQNGFSSVPLSSIRKFTVAQFESVLPAGVLTPAESVALTNLIVKQ